MTLLRSKDIWSGVLFAGFGLAALVLGGNLDTGSAARMGPGFVPRMLGWSLIALGIAIAARGVRRKDENVDTVYWRPLGLVTLAVAAFGFLLEPAGLAAAIVAVVLIGAAASLDTRWREAAAAAAFLVLLCVAIFKLGLGMNLHVLGQVW